MAKQHTTLAPGLVEKLKNASSLDAMKKIYRNMNPAEREAAAGVFVREAKKKPVKSPAPKAKAAAKQQQTPTTPTKPRQQRRTATSSSSTPTKPETQKSPATRGKFRGSNPPSPTVRRKGSTTGAAVDTRERSLRKNLQESKSRKGSTVKGRKNIAAQVREVSGSSKRNQKLVEARRRRAREEALKKNLREMFGSKYNN